ncbi:hypothetical protein V8246_14885 [Pseudoxanthomonas sp. F11]|uniref:hypothetical protein n=1 Tax=Pseudoxanthomonas sp. F11 TaxID=3126308 RepID=UPI00300D057C
MKGTQPRYNVYSQAQPRPAMTPGRFYHRVKVVHDPASPRGDASCPLVYEGFALYDELLGKLAWLLVVVPERGYAMWPLYAEASYQKAGDGSLTAENKQGDA